jgi:hypothetical protein
MTAAEWIIRSACRLLPPRLKDWGEAMAQETASIERPGAAILFAVGCGAWIVSHALGQAFRAALKPRDISSAEAPGREALSWSRDVAFACAITAAGLGLVFLSAAGAPNPYLILNLAALAAGLIIVLPFRRKDPVEPPFIGVISIAVGLTLLATAVFGQEASGARRWLSLGGVVFQPSLIGLPFLLVAFARSRDILTTTGLALGAGAIALQTDQAVAGAILAAIGVAVLVRRDRPGLVMLTVAFAGFILTSLKPAGTSATPFITGVFHTASSTGSLASLAVWGGTALLLLPAVLGIGRNRQVAAAHATFGATWLALIAAAYFGDHPVPVIAFGGSAIVGYLLSTLALPSLCSQPQLKTPTIHSQSLIKAGHDTVDPSQSTKPSVIHLLHTSGR